MSPSNSAVNELATDGDQESIEYRPVSALAIVGLIVALLSVVAYIHPWFWCVPALAAAFCGLALRRMAAAETRQVGRGAALFGLTLSLLFIATAATRLTMYYWQLRAETRQLGKQWFEALHNRDPYRADQFTLLLEQRLQPGDDPVARYAEPMEYRRLSEEVEKPVVRMLLSLGPYAEVRYFGNDVTQALVEHAGVIDIYAVSVRHEGKTTSCFVQLGWTRNLDHGTKQWYWKLNKSDVLTELPKGWNPAS